MQLMASISQTQLKQLINYDPETGLFTRADGRVAGYNDGQGYLQLEIAGRKYRAHRLAWFYMTGKWPKIIDHINLIRSDNRWSNLREVSSRESNLNRRLFKTNRSGIKGVSWNTRRNLWRATIKVDGKLYCLGFYETIALAAAARYAAEQGLNYITVH
jgi:hypothetical protein